jgi:hypothetical protein
VKKKKNKGSDEICTALALSIELSELLHGLPLFQHIPVVYLAVGEERVIVGTRICFPKEKMARKFSNKLMFKQLKIVLANCV